METVSKVYGYSVDMVFQMWHVMIRILHVPGYMLPQMPRHTKEETVNTIEVVDFFPLSQSTVADEEPHMELHPEAVDEGTRDSEASWQPEEEVLELSDGEELPHSTVLPAKRIQQREEANGLERELRMPKRSRVDEEVKDEVEGSRKIQNPIDVVGGVALQPEKANSTRPVAIKAAVLTPHPVVSSLGSHMTTCANNDSHMDRMPADSTAIDDDRWTLLEKRVALHASEYARTKTGFGGAKPEKREDKEERDEGEDREQYPPMHHPTLQMEWSSSSEGEEDDATVAKELYTAPNFLPKLQVANVYALQL